LAVLGIFHHFLASQMQPANFLFGSFLFFSGKREMNSPRPEGAFHPAIFHPDDFPFGRFFLRVADAQTGRPYSNHLPYGETGF
jgi:hypothetical protein